MSLNRMVELIRQGNVDELRSLFALEPGLLNDPFSFKGGDGFALHCAAYHNQPEVIYFLVDEMQQSVNQKKRVSSLFTPLHHAKKGGAYRAAASLLGLGANPDFCNDLGNSTVEFCSLDQVQAAINPKYLEEKKQAEIKGTWELETPKEVAHYYKQPKKNLSLTEIFNFEKRYWRTLVKDLNDGQLTQETIFFDNIPDKTILQEAFDKLQDLGGDADEGSIRSQRKSLEGKYPLGKKKMKV